MPLPCFQTTFIYPWRSYQAKVFQEFDTYKEDDHVHIVAPPGSGKTILGLELMKEVAQPTLILTPTIAIRNQWKQKYLQDFHAEISIEPYISLDIEKPKPITISTYQSFFSKSQRAELPQGFFKVLILDEAHHLLQAWYKKIAEFKKENQVFTISLTATPPYDSTQSEWNNYLEINGEIDLEITIPELVKEKNLAPHQDYLHFSYPTDAEMIALQTSFEKQQNCVAFLEQSDALKILMEKQEFWLYPSQNWEWIYANFEIYTSYLVYMHFRGLIISSDHFEILGYEEEETPIIPNLTVNHLESILNHLFRENTEFWEQNEKDLTLFKKKIRSFGVLERGKVYLRFRGDDLKKTLNSASKMKSVQEILAFETSNNEDIKALVLTDFIRKEYFNPKLQVDKMGLSGIFRQLYENNNALQMGAICGSFLILPSHYNTYFQEDQFSDLEHFEGFMQTGISTQNRTRIMETLKYIFEHKDLKVLIGTRSLLGEGWDAPFINTLVLASQVASFVSINQMRGRVIRTNPSNPHKTASIWHLVGINPYDPEGGSDLKLQENRFERFLGLSEMEEGIITNSLSRISNGFPDSKEKITSFNQAQYDHLKRNKTTLAERWQTALNQGKTVRKQFRVSMNETAIKDYRKTKNRYYKNTLRYTTGIFLSFALGTLFSLENFLNVLFSLGDIRKIISYLLFGLVFSLLIPGVKYLRLYLKYRDITKDFKGITQALLYSLCETQLIKTPITEIDLQVHFTDEGGMYCEIQGASPKELQIFFSSIEEIISPIENPRYFLERKHQKFKVWDQLDYHSVPESLGAKKEFVQVFFKHWETQVGNSELHYTRTPTGRKLLMHAKFHSLSNQLNVNKIEHINKWE